MPVFDYDPPERFVAGALGQPGARVFYLQARAEGRLTTVALEKLQVAALAGRLDELLDEVLRLSGGTAQVPALAPADLADDAPLDVPLAEDFRVGTMALTWDAEKAQVVIEAQEAVDEDDLERPDPAVLRVRISAGAARAFTQRALQIVAAGRPPCPLCGQPLDAAGHVCVRLNGYRGGEAAS
ncbi:DUF3090 domain-containing protein [Nonomuraea fuscirosea]|jgi:uncharacterized repeat protein (TIGR03847 family)|uniref:Putative repeat protein (TIGR03847 family) n=1 Tax=Nonomuraea fuscirosea TaxID=1291556 RepID=A0A2T0MEI5_9ACTN|nr:DUF3090 domain-containing protein [Nonomuraea fuscirosea]PRX55962.1 putative repeat protein (TIGR03847 family) [Nonomuraea fuscirosea]WSA55488.1 DUF3090 domain-containing protein [Nonomuraea fuscirosea]